MADKKMSLESILDISVLRRKRFLRWLRARDENDRKRAKGEDDAPETFTQVQLLDVWGDAAERYVDSRLLGKEEEE